MVEARRVSLVEAQVALQTRLESAAAGPQLFRDQSATANTLAVQRHRVVDFLYSLTFVLR
jgi:hypothetical protein